METNFEELLNNTNLTPTEILEYYLEEIDERFKEFNENFMKFLPYYKNGSVVYSYILQEKAKENPTIYKKLVSMSENIGSLVKEFLGLYELIETSHRTMIYELVSTKNDSLKFLKDFISLHLCGIGGLSDYAIQVHKCLEILITYVKVQEEKEKISDDERLMEEKMTILEYFVDEFNKELNEKEARIYELEDEQAKNEQEIDGLINENVCLRRIIELNSDDDGTY